MTYVTHDKQKIQGAEKEAMDKPFRDFCSWLTSKDGKRNIQEAAREIKHMASAPEQREGNHV